MKKMQNNRIFIAMIGLALMANTAYAGSQSISDSELDGVSAQGLQNINNDNRTFRSISDQNNNLDSVQLNNNSQGDSVAGGIVNSAKSAVNASANLITLGNVSTPPNGDPKTILQTNSNTAKNHVNEAYALGLDGDALAVAANVNKETQRVSNMNASVIEEQNNNNNSVQLNHGAQHDSRGMSIVNASTSAANVGLNALNAGELSDTVTQVNAQYAGNMNNKAGAISAGASAEALAFNAEFGPTQVVNNDAETRVAGRKSQKNNNNSVQLNHGAQSGAQVVNISNVAQSALNVAANLASIASVSGDSTVTQANYNVAENHVNNAEACQLCQSGRGSVTAVAKNLNKQTQKVNNGSDAVTSGQDNNNNSVQINHGGQRDATSGSIVNASVSSANIALNVLNSRAVTASSVSQSNTQTAANMSNSATATGSQGTALATNWEANGATQGINNAYGRDSSVSDQDNNNNSVQVNDSAQASATAVSIVNASKSAINHGANMASLGSITGSTVSQSNDNNATNHVNVALFTGESGTAIAKNLNKQTQNVSNAAGAYQGQLAVVDDQNNNNNSVQVSDDGQSEVTAVALVNVASSAANDAMNVLNAGDVARGSTVSQSNDQSALNYDNLAVALSPDGTAIAGNAETTRNPGQYINNVHAEVNQDNNNNSVQLNDNAQGGVTAGRVVNAAGSAVNVSSNLMVAGDVNGSTVTQSNHQYASNHNNVALGRLAIAGNLNKQTQTVDNCFCTDLSEGKHQNNNMNSVQLNGGQSGMTAINALNAAHSAVNLSYNIMTAGLVTDSHIEQTNTNTAVNFSNIAVGQTALSGNSELGLRLQ